MPRDRRTVLRAGAGALAGVLAGCTGDEGGDDGSPAASPFRSPTDAPTPSRTRTAAPTDTPTVTATSTPTTSPDPVDARDAYPSYQWERLQEVDPVPTSRITMRGTEFHPLVAAFEPETELTVVNEDAGAHTFTVPPLRINERLDGGASASVTIEEAGTFDYLCTLHPPRMLGRLVVTADPPTATPSPTGTPSTTDGSTPTFTPTATPTATEAEGGY